MKWSLLFWTTLEKEKVWDKEERKKTKQLRLSVNRHNCGWCPCKCPPFLDNPRIFFSPEMSIGIKLNQVKCLGCICSWWLTWWSWWRSITQATLSSGQVNEYDETNKRVELSLSCWWCLCKKYLYRECNVMTGHKCMLLRVIIIIIFIIMFEQDI